MCKVNDNNNKMRELRDACNLTPARISYLECLQVKIKQTEARNPIKKKKKQALYMYRPFNGGRNSKASKLKLISS